MKHRLPMLMVVSLIALLPAAGCGRPVIGGVRLANPDVQQGASVPGGSQTISWSQVTSAGRRAILKVSRHYGESSPRVDRVVETTSVAPPYELMYLVSLTGHFHEGKAKNPSLSFSVLADGTEAWAILAPSGRVEQMLFAGYTSASTSAQPQVSGVVGH